LNQSDPKQNRCNLQIVRQHPDKIWQLLLHAHAYVFAQQLSAQNREDFDIAATRVLAASALLKASGLSLETPLLQIRAEADGWQILQAKSHLVLTFVTTMRSQPQPIVFAFYRQQVTDREQAASELGFEGGLRL
jgi:hypothetical protein